MTVRDILSVAAPDVSFTIRTESGTVLARTDKSPVPEDVLSRNVAGMTNATIIVGTNTQSTATRISQQTFPLDGNRELRLTGGSAFVYYKKTGCEAFIACKRPEQTQDQFLETVRTLEHHWHSIGWL